MLQICLVSSLEQPFLDDNFEKFTPLSHISVLKNEPFSLQLISTDVDSNAPHRRFLPLKAEGDFENCVSFYTVENIPSTMPTYPSDDGYLRTDIGLYPDLLAPMQMRNSAPCYKNQLRAVWIDITPNDNFTIGKHELIIVAKDGDSEIRLNVTVNVIDAELPKSDLIFTQWFHYDCLASYYNVPVFSERHFEIIENFMKVAVKNGINMILTPVFTPPLDTYVGGERPTVQLVTVTLQDGKWLFDFSLLDRFIDMCDRIGIKYFEISHLFTQWGAGHAPKIVAQTPCGERRIFGWETDATGEEYTSFLRAFIPAFLSHMKKRGDDSRCYFHISDEPRSEHIEQYAKSRKTVADLLDGYHIIDALSNIEYYKLGLVSSPICGTNDVQPFIDEKVTPLWVYYCCSEGVGVSNRFFGMPGARTRFIGVQMFKYNVVGFLHWGYNFYYNRGSYDLINPFIDSSGNGMAPSGDTYSVYPSPDGNAWESVRIRHFYQGLCDMRAMCLAEKLTSHEEVVRVIEEITGKVVFNRCVCDSETMHRVREAVNALIESHIK